MFLKDALHTWFSRRTLALPIVALPHPSGLPLGSRIPVTPVPPLCDSSCGDNSRLSRVNPPPVADLG